MAEKFVITHAIRGGIRTETFSDEQARKHLRSMLRHDVRVEDLKLVIDGQPTEIMAWLGMPSESS